MGQGEVRPELLTWLPSPSLLLGTLWWHVTLCITSLSCSARFERLQRAGRLEFSRVDALQWKGNVCGAEASSGLHGLCTEMLVGAESFGFQVMALNLVSFEHLRSALILTQRPLAKDSSFTFLPVTFPSCSGGWQRESRIAAGGTAEQQCRPGPPGGKLLSLEAPLRSPALRTTNAFSAIAARNLIPRAFSRFQGPAHPSSGIASIRYCLNKRGVRAAEIASASQTSQSFWGQKFSSCSPCSLGMAEINILTSVNPLFPFSPGLYQLWEGGIGGKRTLREPLSLLSGMIWNYYANLHLKTLGTGGGL